MGNTQIPCLQEDYSSYLPYKPYPFSARHLGKKIDATHVGSESRNTPQKVWVRNRYLINWKIWSYIAKKWRKRRGLQHCPIPKPLSWGEVFLGQIPVPSWVRVATQQGEKPPFPEHWETPWTAFPTCGTWHYHAPFLILTAAILVATLGTRSCGRL